MLSNVIHLEIFVFIIVLIYLLSWYSQHLLYLVSCQCLSKHLYYFKTESIVVWFFCGYLLLSHILNLLCVILIVYQVNY